MPFLQGGVFAYSPEAKDLKDNIYDEFDWKKSKNCCSLGKINSYQIRNQLLKNMLELFNQLLIEDYDPYSEQYVGRLWFQAPEIDGCVYR